LHRATRFLLVGSLLIGPGQAFGAQEIVLDRFERWELYPPPGGPERATTALLLLFVRNDGERLVKHWRAILVARDSLGRELFRFALDRDSADLEPDERIQVELQFADSPTDRGEPYDYLLGNDTTNLLLTFDQTRVVEAGRITYVPAGTLMCYGHDAFVEVERQRYRPTRDVSWLALGDALGCQRAQQELPVEFLADVAPHGVMVRLQRMDVAAWVFAEDLRER
jgi:hypothetical protein